MISEHYAISVDRVGGVITAVLMGRWTRETVDLYKSGLLSAGGQLMAAGIHARNIATLIDARSFGPQDRDVVAYYVRAFDEPRFQSERIAVVYKSTLLKMQARRMAVGTPHFFERIDEATRWLSSFAPAGADGMKIGVRAAVVAEE